MIIKKGKLVISSQMNMIDDSCVSGMPYTCFSRRERMAEEMNTFTRKSHFPDH